MNGPDDKITANADYIGILNALDWLVSIGKITPEVSRKTAMRIAEQLGASILVI
jgi:hypothetical protein